MRTEQTTINLENDKHFIRLVKTGILKVYKDGRVENVKTGRFIGYKSKKGYKNIGSKIAGTKIVMHILVHRLVYIVHKYKMKPLPFIVNHKDGNKSNNKISNLEPSTYSENNKHAYSLGLKSHSKKVTSSLINYNRSNSKLTDKQAIDIRYLRLKFGYTHAKIARLYGVDRSSISTILAGKSHVYAKIFYYHPYAVLTRRNEPARLSHKRLVHFRKAA